jgi:hypothetical protein
MKKILFACFSMAILAVSCKKDDASNNTPAVEKFLNTTAGSTWNYRSTDNTTSTVTDYVLTSTSRDTSINGKSYHVYTNSDGNTSEYYNVTGNDYSQFTELTAPLDALELLYLKDNLAIGSNWSQNVPINGAPIPLTATVTNTIEEKGNSLAVNGVTYSNVIKVRTGISVAGLPASAITTNIVRYYAPKFGEIKSDVAIGINYGGLVNNSSTSTQLMSANLQ